MSDEMSDETSGEPNDDGRDLSGADDTDEVFVPDDISSLVDDEVAEAEPDVEIDLDMSDITADDVVKLLDERDQFLEAYRRSQADFENFRKQAHKRQGDEVGRVLGRFVENLLPVLDAGDAAMAHGADGATEVFTALLGALEKEGLQRVDPLGEPFDPNVAEAVMHEPGEGGEQVVAEVLRIGYLWNERVLRPAMVKVKD